MAGVQAEVPGLPEQVPEDWPFGAAPAQPDEVLGLVLGGTKTGTASSLPDHEAEGEPLPAGGCLYGFRQAARATDDDAGGVVGSSYRVPSRSIA